MKRSAALFICMLLAQSCLGQASVLVPAAKGSPETFVSTLIQHEQRASKADEEAQAGLHGAEAIYTPGLLALIRKDRHSTPAGYAGKLDWDPICD